MSEVFLVGVDDSAGSSRAVEFAAECASSSGARLVVAYVIEWSPYSFMTPEELEQRQKQHDEEIQRAQSRIVEPLVASLKQKGLDVSGRVRHGHASEVMCDLAREENATQVIVGRRGVSKMKALMFGSVSGSLVQICPVPVTVVP